MEGIGASNYGQTSGLDFVQQSHYPAGVILAGRWRQRGKNAQAFHDIVKDLLRHFGNNRRVHQRICAHDANNILPRLFLRGCINNHQMRGLPLHASSALRSIGHSGYGAALTFQLLNKGAKTAGLPVCNKMERFMTV